MKKDLNISKEKLNKVKEEYNNFKAISETNIMKLNKLNQENENLLQKSAEIEQINKNKNDISQIKKNNELLIKENKNLLDERDKLNKEKNQLSNELEKLEKEIKELSDNTNNNDIISTENNDILLELKEINENRKNELKKLKDEYENLINEQKILQDNYDKLPSKNNGLNVSMVSMSVMSMNGYQLSPDEYEEYDLLRKNKDENEALIVQLKSNNQAKEVEKQELKEILKNLTGKK